MRNGDASDPYNKTTPAAADRYSSWFPMTPTLIPSFDEAAARAAALACGARLDDDPHGPQARFDRPVPRAALAEGAVALLPDWGIVAIGGDEAVRFLHAQTTIDIEQQPADEVRLNGYCTPKGRLLAGGPLWREDGGLRFAVSRALARPLARRLSMYVLRAKVEVRDTSDALAVLGLCGSAAPAALRELGIEPPGAMRLARSSSGQRLA
jgi:hypothetical protein